jgi:solute carrier family 6 amino acid transporter-like protein 5/7/9/14
LCGLPIFLLENVLGQFSSQGPVRAFNGMPIVKGIGFSMVAVSMLVAPYYNVILSWVLYYIYETAMAYGDNVLPWEKCLPEYGDKCMEREKSETCKNILTDIKICSNFTEDFNIYSHTSIMNLKDKDNDITKYCIDNNNQFQGHVDTFFNSNCSEYVLRMTAPEFFYESKVLGLPGRPDFNYKGGVLDKITSLNGIQKHLAVTLFISWVIIGISIIRGVKSTGKTMYFTATFPYLVLTILLIKGVQLEGATDGIKFFLTPDTSKLSDPVVWKDAATQIFYSLSVSWGGLLTLSSYNPFKNNLIRDTYIVVITNSATSIYAGIAIFAYLGYMANTLQLPLETIVAGGPGFAFIVWPEAMSHISQNHFVCITFSLIFFMMLYSLGLSTMVVTVETVVTSILDLFINLREQRVKVVSGIIILNYIIGIPMICSRGLYWFQVFDDYAASYSLVVSAVTEMIAISYIYGLDRISSDVLMMGEIPLNKYFRYAWSIITPFILIITLIMNIAKHSYSKFDYFGVSYVVGYQSIPLAIFLVFLPISCIIILAIREINRQTRYTSFNEKFIAAGKPTRHWGPINNKDRKENNHLRQDGLIYKPHNEITNDKAEEEKGLKMNPYSQSTSQNSSNVEIVKN